MLSFFPNTQTLRQCFGSVPHICKNHTYHVTVSLHELFTSQKECNKKRFTCRFLTLGGFCNARERKRSNGPHGRVQGDSFGVVQLLVQEGDTCLSVLVTHEDPVVHVIHKVEVSGEPVDGHLLHICAERSERREEGVRWDTGRAGKNKNSFQ